MSDKYDEDPVEIFYRARLNVVEAIRISEDIWFNLHKDLDRFPLSEFLRRIKLCETILSLLLDIINSSENEAYSPGTKDFIKLTTPHQPEFNRVLDTISYCHSVFNMFINAKLDNKDESVHKVYRSVIKHTISDLLRHNLRLFQEMLNQIITN